MFSDRNLKYSILRNSLIVLTKIIQHFPAIQNLATVIEKRVEKVFNQIQFRLKALCSIILNCFCLLL